MGSWPGSDPWAAAEGVGVWSGGLGSLLSLKAVSPELGLYGAGVRVGMAYAQAFAVITRLAHWLEPSSNRKRR